MSILSDLMSKKNTWDQAKARLEGWFSKIGGQLGDNPAVAAAAGAALSDLKQAASNAVALADTLAGPIIAAGAVTVNAATQAAIKTYLGPFGAVASAPAKDGIYKIANALKAEIDAAAAEIEASLTPPGPAPAPLQAAPAVIPQSPPVA